MVWLAGTKTSSHTAVLLPVPRIAPVNQVSLTLIVVWPDKKEPRFRRPPALGDAADDQPAAMIDAAGEGEIAGDAIAAVDRRDPSGGLHRGRDRNIKTVRPNRLLRGLGKMADIMRMMNHQAGAPAMRSIGLADFAHHLEPGVEAQSIAPEPLRNENACNAGGQQRIDASARQRARFLGRGGAVPDRSGSAPAPAPERRRVLSSARRRIVLAHHSAALLATKHYIDKIFYARSVF